MTTTVDGELIPVESGLIEQQSRAEIDMQIATAKQYPRDIVRAEEEARSIIKSDKETAAQCYYSLPPRDGKSIEGPSVRLAEILVYTMQNIRVDSQVVGESADGKAMICQGTAFDAERNIASRVQVRRRIVDRNNRRYGEDVINQTTNAAISIAGRNAVFKVVPRFLADKLYKEAMKIAVGSDDEISANIKKWAAYFEEKGIDEKTLLKHLGRRSLKGIKQSDAQYLIGLRSAIEDGEASIKEVFAVTRSGKPMGDAPAPKSKKDDVQTDDDKARETMIDTIRTGLQTLHDRGDGDKADTLLVTAFGMATLPDDATMEQLIALQEAVADNL